MKIYIPIISYNGNVTTEFMSSMLLFQQYLMNNKHEAVFYPITFESLISRARNAAAADFLNSNMDYLFFVDTDIIFNPSDFEKLLKLDVDVCAGIYPKKYLNTHKMNYISSNNVDSQIINNIERYSTDFSSEIDVRKHIDDVVEVNYAATGFMLIKKTALLNIIDKHPEIEYNNDIDGYGMNKKFYNFFQIGINSKKKYLSEDYGFCALHKSVGGKIYCTTNTNLAHIGRKSYTGNVQEQASFWGNI